IRAHLYGCAMLPEQIGRKAQAARQEAQSLVKQSHQLSDAVDVLLREAEATLYALRDTIRRAPMRSEHPARQIRLPSYHVLPMHLQVGDRFSDDTGEWEVASRPYSTASGESVNVSVRRVGQPAMVEDRTWLARERIRVSGALSG